MYINDNYAPRLQIGYTSKISLAVLTNVFQ